MDEIRRDVQRLHESLRTIEAELSQSHNNKVQSADDILALLREPLQSFKLATSESTTKAIRNAMQGQLDKWQKCLDYCKKVSRERSEVQEKKSQLFPKHLMVTVFGRTNAGKSTFGNFIKGKDMAQALFDNAYKTSDGHEAALQCSPITVLEDAHLEVTNAPPYDWFKEGTLETTREAQVFLAPGIAWLDTPGIGSNTVVHEALAQKYAEHTDVLLYLDSSDSPGLRDHASILRRFLERGCPTWAIINRSDKKQHVKDADGRYLRTDDGSYLKRLHPKSPEDRHAQEEQEMKALREAGYGESRKNLRVFSTSVQMAVLATAEQDPQQALEYWHGSNIIAVYDIFADLVANPENLLRFKHAESRRNLRTLVNIILEGAEANVANNEKKMDGLESILCEMMASLKRLQALDACFDADKEAALLQQAVLTRVQVHIGEVVKAAASTDGKQQIDVVSLQKKLNEIMRQHAHDRAKKLLTDIFESDSFAEMTTAKAIQTPELSRIQETREYTVREMDSYARAPEGVIEHVCSLFGKKYWRPSTREVTQTQVIDLGFNTGEVRKEILEQVTSIAKEYLHSELSALKQHCLGAYIQAMGNGIAAVLEVMEKLHTRCEELKD